MNLSKLQAVIFLMVLTVSSVTIARETPVLNCKVTTSWHHELNFQHHTFEASKWVVAMPTRTAHLVHIVKIPSSEGHSIVIKASANSNFDIETLSIRVIDSVTETEFQTWTRLDHLTLNLLFPERSSRENETINQLDLSCSIK